MRHKAIFLRWTTSILLVIAGLFVYLPSIVSANAILGQELEIVKRTNYVREEAGLAPLTVDVRLRDSAYNKAWDMAQKGYFSHTSPDGARMGYWINGAGYYYDLAGENLAKGFDSVDRLMAAWKNSPTHMENLIEPRFRHIGVAMAEGELNGNPVVFVVQHFGVEDELEPISTGGTESNITTREVATNNNLEGVDIEPQHLDVVLPIAIANTEIDASAENNNSAQKPRDVDRWMIWSFGIIMAFELIYLLWLIYSPTPEEGS